MNIAAQYAVVNNAGLIIGTFPGTEAGLEAAWDLRHQYRDDTQGVVLIGVKGIKPITPEGSLNGDTLEPIRDGVPDPVLGDKVRHLL